MYMPSFCISYILPVGNFEVALEPSRLSDAQVFNKVPLKVNIVW